MDDKTTESDTTFIIYTTDFGYMCPVGEGYMEFLSLEEYYEYINEGEE